METKLIMKPKMEYYGPKWGKTNYTMKSQNKAKGTTLSRKTDTKHYELRQHKWVYNGD